MNTRATRCSVTLTPRPSGWLVAPLLALLPAFGAQAAPAIGFSAKASYSNGILTYQGAAAKANVQISVFDEETGILLNSRVTDKKKKFSYSIPLAAAPCAVRVEAGATKKVIKVTGAGSSCSSQPVCFIKKPSADTLIDVDGAVKFVAGSSLKGNAFKAATFTWNFGDGTAAVTGASLSHTYSSTGTYRVTLSSAAGGSRCTDDVVVSVAPAKGTNTFGKVIEAKAPDLAGAMPRKDGTNDTDAYVVLPFEETGMQGGSQIFLPYNVMINYNSLNAQVIQKKAHQPKLNDGTDMEVFYSAASNPKDPVKDKARGDSINSTSQNLFADGHIGANVDLVASTTGADGLPTKNVFVDGHDFAKAAIRKSEQWDRMFQTNAATLGKDQTGFTYADKQLSVTSGTAITLAKPDEGVPGSSDKAEGRRSMPGVENPYSDNKEQPFVIGTYKGDANAVPEIKAYQPNTYIAQNIPISDVDDQGRVNPYPLLRVQAKDKSGNLKAAADAVYTSTSETRCRECHLPGGMAANEDVWRRPVTEDELTVSDGQGGSLPGPATGAGSYDPGTDASKPWPPAIHNRFDDTYPANPGYTNLGVTIPRDANNLRTDRIKASRWYNVKTKAVTDVNAVRPVTDKADPTYADWQLQIQLKFRRPDEFGGTGIVEQEKAAIFNTLVMHDYMVFYGPTPAAGKDWPLKPSTQVADNYGDDVGLSRSQPMYFCSGHHTSQLKFEAGVTGKSYPTNRSDYSRAFHAFHGKFQVYKQDVTAEQSSDGLAHAKGELIRDERGHPLMFGGRGWDSQLDDDNQLPLTKSSPGDPAAVPPVPADPTYDPANPKALNKPTVPTWDAKKNNWRPDLFPMNTQGELMFQFGERVAMEENCVKCHTGATEKSYRDIHHGAGLKCDNCHGNMLAVGNAYGNEKFNANLTGGGAYGADNPNAIDPTDFRRPWLDEPDCGSCHVGDGNLKKDGDKVEDYAYQHFFSEGVLKQAYGDDDLAQRTLDPMNARFAVMPTLEDRPDRLGNSFVQNGLSTVLFRKSPDVHGSGVNGDLTCGTCHGGSHAIWPNPNPDANDNVTAKQLQGYTGNIVECSVCHAKDDFKTGLVATDGGNTAPYLGVAQGVRANSTKQVNGSSAISPVFAKSDTGTGRAYLAGPHGMHPVGDEFWWKHADGAATNVSGNVKPTINGGWHNDMAGMPGPDGEDQCAACHGDDHKGTRLSKALTDRQFVTEKGKKFKVAAGTVIGCDLCHALDKSFSTSPDPTKPDHGWQKPKMHMPPEPIVPVAGTGGGGGHH